jgi:hypothetical protein
MTKDEEQKIRELSKIEKKTHNFIKEEGEIQTTDIHDKHMCGAVVSLKNMGLVEVFKKYTSYYRKRKKRNLLESTQNRCHIAFELGIELDFILKFLIKKMMTIKKVP